MSERRPTRPGAAGSLALLLGLLAGAAPAAAQLIDRAVPWSRPGCPPRCGDPRAEDLIDQLRPNLPARGIRVPEAPAAAAVAAATSAGLNIPFASGSAVISPGGRQALARFAEAARTPALAAMRFRIAGHADASGSAAANQRLSEARAKAVLDELVERLGLDPARFEVVGLGAPARAPGAPPAVDPRDRRVEIRAIPP